MENSRDNLFVKSTYVLSVRADCHAHLWAPALRPQLLARPTPGYFRACSGSLDSRSSVHACSGALHKSSWPESLNGFYELSANGKYSCDDDRRFEARVRM
jgi:hypothetical protein